MLVLSCFAPVYVFGSVGIEIEHTHAFEGEPCHYFPGEEFHSTHHSDDCHHGHSHSHDVHSDSKDTPSEKPDSPSGNEPAPHHHVITLNLDFAQPVSEPFALRPDSKPEGRIHSKCEPSPEEPYLEITKPPQQA